MPLDPEVAALLERQQGQPPRSSLSVAETRERLREAGALAGPPPPLALVEDLRLPGLPPIRHYCPTTDAGQPVVLFFHGGRFFSGDLDSHDTICRLLARAAGCRVMAVAYRLAPEHPFPAAAEDACRALEWVSNQAVPVATAGDSAGANLAAVAALTRPTPSLRCQVLIYPMLDPECGSPSYAAYAEGYGPGAIDMQRGWSLYLPPGTNPRNPVASPLHAPDTSGQPPAFVLTAEYDTLRDEGEAYARKLSESGNRVQLRRYPGTIHGFFTMPGALGVAREAMSDIAEFLRLHLGESR
ncbi:MAG: alpha/beta hydrolase [Acidobacteria bacterium]|nr:alpha/beta hydrolase [Acidobacteriota bacterium]